MAKKKTFLYAIYACAVIVCLSLFLVLRFNVFAKETDGIIYAENIVLNCPREFEIEVGTTVTLNNDFIKITPANFSSKMEYEVSNESLTFNYDARTLKAGKTGAYYITFSVQTSKNAYKKEKLKITATANCRQNDIKLKTNSIKLGTNANLADIFEIVNSSIEFNIIVEDSNILEFNNNCFFAKNVGQTNVVVSIFDGYISYSYSYTFSVEANEEVGKPENPDNNNQETQLNTPNTPNENENQNQTPTEPDTDPEEDNPTKPEENEPTNPEKDNPTKPDNEDTITPNDKEENKGEETPNPDIDNDKQENPNNPENEPTDPKDDDNTPDLETLKSRITIDFTPSTIHKSVKKSFNCQIYIDGIATSNFSYSLSTNNASLQYVAPCFIMQINEIGNFVLTITVKIDGFEIPFTYNINVI